MSNKRRQDGRYELTDCPFCGSSDVILENEGDPSERHCAVCNECGVIGPTAANEYNAVRLWNLRP